MPKLSIEGLKVTYGPIIGTDGVSFTLDAGETVALIGSNGAGKSSTLKAILGMATYPQGRITLDGTDLKGLKPSQVMGALASHPKAGASSRNSPYPTICRSAASRAPSRRCPSAWNASTATFRVSRSVPASVPDHSPVASSRCSPSAAH